MNVVSIDAAQARRVAYSVVLWQGAVTIVVALSDRMPGEVQSLVTAVPVIWTVFFASLLLMSPFLARSQHMMREFAMLAGVSTLATSVIGTKSSSEKSAWSGGSPSMIVGSTK